MTEANGKRLIVGISGASGIALAVRLLEIAAAHHRVSELHVVVSNSSLRVASSELVPPASTPAAILERCRLDAASRAKLSVHPNADIGAVIASGSYVTDGMVIVPCSAGTLASIAHGISRDLIQRAADLTLKERRRLVIALRETPLSLVHAENIVTATRAGAIVMPPVPSFYAGQSWDSYLDHFAMRVLDLFGIDIGRDDLRWKGARGDE
ncbi:MAG: UbiX family flavin prenyltransferase [Thermoanaerobaculia bacterium]|nr:UbiX family flavin prenyltransferase [Thermoanaerobaculia bacterium]